MSQKNSNLIFAGRLDMRITIQRLSSSQESTFGTANGTWINFAAEIPAEVQDVLPSKSETAIQGLLVAANPSLIHIRWMPGIDSSMRIIIHGEEERICEITAGPSEIGRREGIELMVTEYLT